MSNETQAKTPAPKTVEVVFNGKPCNQNGEPVKKGDKATVTEARRDFLKSAGVID